MNVPVYGEDTVADLASTHGVYDNAHNSTAGSVYADNMRGTGDAKGLLGGADTYSKSLGGNPDSQAIQAKYMRQYGTGQSQVQNEEKQKADTQYFDRVTHANDLVQQEQTMNYNRRMEKYKQDLARSRARGAVVGQVLGVVGGVVGGIYGGPAGAMAGYAAGNAVGSAVGNAGEN